MAKLQKLVTVTTYRWEEVDLTEEQADLFKDDEYAFMENYFDGEYDLDFDLTGDKVLENEGDFELLED